MLFAYYKLKHGAVV